MGLDFVPATGHREMGISRDSRHKRRHTGGRRKIHQKKRKYELGRQPANTRIGSKRIHLVRCRGGMIKKRALRLDSGNISWKSENRAFKTRVMNVVYNASNNELVRTQTLVKNCIVEIDAAPFKQYYLQQYGIVLGKALAEEEKASKSVEKKRAKRMKVQSIDETLKRDFKSGKLLACLSSRPGQCGRADGYILEGAELTFYKNKINKKKRK